MKVFVIGGGGREHALVWKLRQSRGVEKIYCAPGNAGIDELAEQGGHDRDTMRALVKLLVWARQTETGDRSELLLQPEERDTWERASAAAGCGPESCAAAASGHSLRACTSCSCAHSQSATPASPSTRTA